MSHAFEAQVELVLGFLPVFAVRPDTVGIEMQRVIVDAKSSVLGDSCLPFFNFSIVEFLDVSTLNAYEVVVMVTLVKFENGFPRLEMMANQQPGLFKLSEYAIDRSQPDFHAFVEQQPVNVFCREMALIAILEQVEDLEPGQRRLQPFAFQILRGCHFRTDDDE
jgi:hypothetical protein